MAGNIKEVWSYDQVDSSLCIFRCIPTYETATTRQHYHGRTATVRSCTQEALELAKALETGTSDKKVKWDIHCILFGQISKHLVLTEADDQQWEEYLKYEE